MWVGSRSSTATFGLERMLRPLQRSSPCTGQTTLVKAATVIGHPTCAVSPASQLPNLCNIMLPPDGHATYTKPSPPTVTRGKSPAAIAVPAVQVVPPLVEQEMRMVKLGAKSRHTL